MKAIRLGLAIWAYKPWVGDFYPPKTPAAEFLTHYGQQLRAVEGNTTFYAVPSASTLAGWRDRVPSGFHFCPKFPQAISHQGALVPRLEAAVAFVDLLRHHLADRLGPLLLQLPPSYGPESWEDLVTFLAALDAARAGVDLALEVRHPAWFAGEAQEQLQAHLRACGIARAILDTRPIYRCPDDPQLTSERRKPELPLQPAVTADFTLVRYISHPDPARNQPYWQEWRSRLASWQTEGKRIYFFVHCPDEARSPQHLRDFCAGLQHQGLAVEFAPWQAAAPQQLSLF